MNENKNPVKEFLTGFEDGMRQSRSAARMEKAERIALYILLAAFGILVFGTVAVPTVLACFYHTWKWLLLYPGCLLVIVIYASATSRKK